jgi:hypothetical protein
VWFGVSMIGHLLIAVIMVLELVRLTVGTYTPEGWVISVLGQCMWAARLSVIVSMVELTWTYVRLDRLTWDDPLFIISTLWMTGSLLGSPHIHSTSCVVIPCGFVIDRMILSGFRYNTECGYAGPCDIDHMDSAAPDAIHILVLRSTVRLFLAALSVLLFMRHFSNHHDDSRVHVVAVVVHAVLSVLYRVRVSRGQQIHVRAHRKRRGAMFRAVDRPPAQSPMNAIQPNTQSNQGDASTDVHITLEASPPLLSSISLSPTKMIDGIGRLNKEKASALDMIASMITGQRQGTVWKDAFKIQQHEQRRDTPDTK